MNPDDFSYQLDNNGNFVTVIKTNSASNAPVWHNTSTYHETVKPKITMDQEQFARIFQPVEYLNLPEGLDMNHPTVMAAVADWYTALEQLKVKHHQLKMLNELAKENESNSFL